MADEPIPVLANSLMVAIENEDKPELIRIFLEAYYQSKLTDLVNLTVRGYDVTPLMHAIRCKADIDIIYKLVNAGADVNEENDKTPLGELLSNVTARSTTGESRYIRYTVEVFIILLNKGVDVTQKSDGKTPLELARLPHHDQPTARGKYSQQGIIDMIEQRIELEPSLMNLTDKMDNVDEEPLETLVESMKEELKKPRPESSDGKKYLQLLDTCQTYTGLTPLFFMLKHSHPPENLLTFYNLFKENYHPKTTDSGEENILDQTYDTQTPIMIFFTRFNSKTINAYNNPVDLLRNMCEDLKVGKDALTGVLRTGHRSRAEEINKRDMFGLTALDYAEAAGVQEYIDIIKQIYPNAKMGTELGNISDQNSPFNGTRAKTGMMAQIFGSDTPQSTPPYLTDFRVSPAATPEPATPEPATPGPATPGPATPRTPNGSRGSSPSTPPPNIARAAREESRPPPLMMDLGDSPEPVTPTTPSTPPFSPSLLRTPDTYTPPSSPPPLRGMADDDTPPRMMDLAESPSPAPADPDQIKRFFDAIKANNISDTRDVMQEAFFQNNLEALVSSTDPENAVLKKPPMVVAAESIVEYELFLLLVYNGVDINATSSDGQGPLHYLADMTNPDYLTFTLSLTNSLINQGANVFMKDNNGKTALDIALEALHEIPESNRHATFKLIIKEIEDRMDKKVQEPFQELRNIIDNVDEDPIEKVLEDLRKLPLDDYIVGLEDNEGLNSLMYAIKYFAEPQHLRLIYDFITSIDDLMELTFKGKTAPMVFLDKYPNYNSDTADFFSVLCSNVPDINHQDLFGLTVLDYAEKTGAQEYIDIVLTIPGAKRGKDMPPNPDQYSLFFGESAVYPEKEQNRKVLASKRRKAPKLPEDPTELENMYFAESNKLISPAVTEKDAEYSLDIIDRILDKNSELINKYIEDSGLTLLMFSIKINPAFHEVIENLIATCNVYGADVLIKSKSGHTVFELAIDQENWPVVEILLNYHPLKDLIPEEKDGLVIYNSLNTYYERYSEELKKGLPDPEKRGLEKKLRMVSILLKAVFGDLFNIVITSSSEDNYKWLPENLNRNIVNMNFGIEDLPDDKNYIETVCVGVVKSTGDVIKNNAKILEYLLKNGVHAYNELHNHEPLEDTPLALVLFERVQPSLPSAEMVRLLLDYGAPVYLRYKTVTKSGQYSEEFLWTIIEYFKEKMGPTPTTLSPGDQKIYQEEYEKIITLLYQGIALGVILLTPKTIDDALSSKMMFQEERAKMLKNLIKFHPEAFTGYPKPTEEFEIKKIDPNKEAFNYIMFGDERIEDFLEEDRKNHVVLSNYDMGDDQKGTFLINLEDLRNLIEVDYSPLNDGEIDEDNVVIHIDNPDFNPVEPEHPRTNPMRIPVDGFNPANPDHVPVPGKKGGRGILFKCNKLNNEGSAVLVGSVDNFVPYVDLRGIAGWGLLIPILEVYDKLLNKSVEKRGQYFSYKIFEENVEPLAGIGNIEWIDINNRGTNRYGGRLNYVSGAHCQTGQSGNVANLITAEPMATGAAKPLKLDPFLLNDEELRSALTAEGVKVGPINDTTRKSLQKKLERILIAKPTAGGKKRRNPSKSKKTAKRNNITVNKKNIYKKMNKNRKKTVRKK